MTGLTPVSFKKGRGHAPRLSPVPVRGRTSERHWRPDEDAVLRQHYPTGGFAACQRQLLEIGSNKAQGRGIYLRARFLDLRGPKVEGPRQRRPELRTPEMDERIRSGWAELRGRGAVQRFADDLGIPRSALSRRAEQLGLSMPHRKEPAWTAAEESLLPTLPLHDLHRASAVMRSLGYHRTPVSIQIKAKRLQISRRRSDVLSATGVAKILGCDSKKVTRWCIEGDLPSTRQGTDRLPQQGGDCWSIRPADLRRFVIDNLDQVDIRRVDKHAFVDLLVSTPQVEHPPAAAASSVERNAAPMVESVPVPAAPLRKARSAKAKPARRTLAEILADCGNDALETRPTV